MYDVFELVNFGNCMCKNFLFLKNKIVYGYNMYSDFWDYLEN